MFQSTHPKGCDSKSVFLQPLLFASTGIGSYRYGVFLPKFRDSMKSYGFHKGFYGAKRMFTILWHYARSMISGIVPA